MPRDGVEVPSTLRRSPDKAQRTYVQALQSAEQSYDGDAQRARRTAWAAVKHSFEKVGDHWEPKERRGPSDAQAQQGGAAAPERPLPTHGGVDAVARSRQGLYARARELGIAGRSKMNKAQLAEAIRAANDRATARARV